MSTRLEKQYTWMDDRSVWQETVRQTRVPSLNEHGYWVMGNGRVFAVRHELPFTRLHSILGPSYARDEDFSGWGTQDITLRRHGADVEWETQNAFRVRRTAILGAELHNEELRMLVQDVAPPEWPVILRSISVQNLGDQTIKGLELDITLDNVPFVAQRIVLPNGFELSLPEKKLRVTALDGDIRADADHIRISLPKIYQGDEEMLRILLVTGKDDEELSLLTEKVALNPDGLPGVTYHWWQHWMADGLTLASDDIALADLFDETTILIACQQGASGAMMPLVQRSSALATEEVAPIRWLACSGKAEMAAKTLHARYAATCMHHRFIERLTADEYLPDTVPEPDWNVMTPPSAWTAAAVIRAHWEYWRYTGDIALITDHFNYLRWLMATQPDNTESRVAYGGDEPFYTMLQHALPDVFQHNLLPDPQPYAEMRAYPWGAVPAMARVMAQEQLAAMAEVIGWKEEVAALLQQAAQLREATDATYWLPQQGYYAAAQSRVDNTLFLPPHLPTALAALTTGYATSQNTHAQDGLSTALGFLLDEAGLPALLPGVPVTTGELLGELLAGLVEISDDRVESIYLAIRANIMPSGTFRTRIAAPEWSRGEADGARPNTSATNALAILTYLCALRETGDHLVLIPHLLSESTRIHIANLHHRDARFDIQIRRHDHMLDVNVGNSGRGRIHMSISSDGSAESSSRGITPGGQERWTHIARKSMVTVLPAPQAFQAAHPMPAEARMLILTVDADSFDDWRNDAVLLDSTIPITPGELAEMLVHENQRRYDIFYRDVPAVGAQWTGLSDDFWHDTQLQSALANFCDLGGHVWGTRYLTDWMLYIPQHDPVAFSATNGTVALPESVGTITATGRFQHEGVEEQAVVLLYAADGTDVELWINGDRAWRRGDTPECQRVRITTRLQPGENIFTVHTQRRSRQGYGFILGVRGTGEV